MDIKIPRKKAEPVYDEKKLKIITKKYLRDLCEELELYTTPVLNDKLYLHYKGFSKIDNLDEYVNLTALYLDHNCIRRIENIFMLRELRCLYLQSNMITQIEGLESLKKLMTLNLSHNQITMVENLEDLPMLQSLNLSHNYLLDVQSIEKLVECQTLRSVDLSNNDTKYSANALSVFTGLKNLACLYLRDNPVKQGIMNYRKTMISSIPTLVFLDEKPVTESDRRLAEAWQKGGKEAEDAEKVKIFEEKKEKDLHNFLENKEMVERGQQRKKAELQRLEQEAREKQEELLREKEKLLETKPEGWEGRFAAIRSELEENKKYLHIDENVGDEKVIKNYAGISKFKCLMKTTGENGEDIYLNATKEEVEEYLNSQKQRREQREREEEEHAREQEREKENAAANTTTVGDVQKIEPYGKALKERNQEETEENNPIKEKGKEEEGFRWTKELEDQLEDLVEENFFDFSKVAEQLNAIVKKEVKKSSENKGKNELNADQIRKKWTEMEMRYRDETTA